MLVGGSQGHGAFTYSILRGLQGAAADKGVVWISDLFSHGSKEVPRLTTGKQHPHSSQITGANLPLFVVDEKVHPVIAQEEVVPITPVPGLALAPPKRGGRKGCGYCWVPRPWGAQGRWLLRNPVRRRRSRLPAIFPSLCRRREDSEVENLVVAR